MATTRKQAAKPKGAAADVLKAIQQNKDLRDQEKVSREQQESAALLAYAEAVGAAHDARAKAEAKIEKLRAQIEQLTTEADSAASAFEPEQAAALRTLSALGNSADDIGQLVGLSAKRVRALIKVAEGASDAAGETGRKSAPGTPGQSAEPAQAVDPAPANAEQVTTSKDATSGAGGADSATETPKSVDAAV